MSTAEPEAFWFGREVPRCFGMLHRSEAVATAGVVICNGLGFEGLIASRPLAELAVRLVASGYSVLRFDYEGTGDSDGGDWEPRRVEQWLESIDEAVRVLRAKAGVEEIYLAGIRMGATLACLYAHDHPGIAGLALWVPCIDGATYVREMRALSRLSAGARPPQNVAADWFPTDSLEVAGFELARTTAEDLRRINLVESLRHPPVRRVVVIDHINRPAADPLTQKLSDLGSAVEHVPISGYAEFMVDDETKSILPVEALDRLTDWFARARGPQGVQGNGRQTDPLRVPICPAAVSPNVIVTTPIPGHMVPPGSQCPPVVEKAIRLPGELFAIMTDPVEQALRRRVAVVILNTGLTNRVGQGRLSTELARYWGGLGFTVIRVDLGGAGDSPLPGRTGEKLTYAPERLEEVSRVADWARQHCNVDRVVLYGICSGAYQSFHAALRSAAIDSAILVNPAIWYNDNSRRAGQDIQVARYSTRAAFRREEWLRLFREPRATWASIRQAAHGFALLTRVTIGLGFRRLGFEFADPVPLARDLDRIAVSGVDLLVVFAAVEMGADYLRTFGGGPLARLQRSGQLRIVDIDGGDHVFSAPGARQRLVSVVTRYLDDTYPSPRRSSAPDPGVPAPDAGDRPDELESAGTRGTDAAARDPTATI